MKAILEFDLPQDKEDFDTASRATDYKLALQDIGNRVFRPARKHGYNEGDINAFLTTLPEGDGEKLIGLLEQLYFSILEEYDVEDL